MGRLEEVLACMEGQDAAWRKQARARLEQLTMPRWALGRLMDLAVDLAGMARSLRPPLARRSLVVMAADHGVSHQGVSQYPRQVTAQMVRNFAGGGAAINALARVGGARLVLVDMGVDADLSDLRGKVRDGRIGPGTADISAGPAMDREQALQALETGIGLALELGAESDLFALGDMGIGNTTPSAALAACLLARDPEEVTGHGTGIDEARRSHKVEIVRRALACNRPDRNDPLGALAGVGGFEIGGLAGLILGAASLRRPVVVDGFIATAAALLAAALSEKAADFLVLAHASPERGHALMCQRLGKEPLLSLGLRLGEGSGAALALPLVEAAGRLLCEVCTFEEAGVSSAD